MGLKGLFFTIDALLGLILIISVITSSSVLFIEDDFEIESHLGEDLIYIFSEVPIQDLDESNINNLIGNGTATGEESVFELIGQEYAKGNEEIIDDIIGNLVSGLIKDKEGIAIYLEEDLVFFKETTSDRSREVYNTFISGIEKNKPTKGYVSRAVNYGGLYEQELIIPINTQGSGWKGNDADPGRFITTKNFEVPSNITLLQAELKIALEIEDKGSDWDVANINNLCYFKKSDLNFEFSDSVVQDFNISNCINSGNNFIKIEGQNQGSNGRIYLRYEQNVVTTVTPNQRITKRYYFDNLKSIPPSGGCSGAWQTLAFRIPEDASNFTGTLNLEATGITDFTGNQNFKDWNSDVQRQKDYDYILFVNGNEPYDYDGSPSSNFNISYNISSELIESTNVITVFFNNYGDTCWGGNTIELKADSVAQTGSYVEVSYDMEYPYKFGSLKFNKVQEFNDGPDKEVLTDFSFPNESVQKGDVFVNLVQRSAVNPSVYAEINNPPTDLAYQNKLLKAVPSNIFIPDTMTSFNTKNYVFALDKSNNYILPDSAINYEFYIPISVPFGDVFNTSEEANNDSIARLQELMGEYYNENFDLSSSSITDVPTLWGPLNVEVVIWK